jgi:hypothetical protein
VSVTIGLTKTGAQTMRLLDGVKNVRGRACWVARIHLPLGPDRDAFFRKRSQASEDIMTDAPIRPKPNATPMQAKRARQGGPQKEGHKDGVVSGARELKQRPRQPAGSISIRPEAVLEMGMW